MSFTKRLDEACDAQRSLLCVGLDPDPRQMPVSDVFEFNRAIVDATVDLVCAYKPNLAFYEALGLPGLEALERTVKHIRSRSASVVIIGDAKRGDISSTADAYARALFDVWGFDAATVSPYLGRDSVEPFLKFRDRGVFVLCRTSNPGSADFQSLVVRQDQGQQPLYEVVALRTAQWDISGNLGLVVGATYPGELETVRRLCPQAPLLVPGVGTQGGDLETSIRLGVDARGRSAIINVSRAVLYASRSSDFAAAARKAAQGLREGISKTLEQMGLGWS